RTVRRGLVDYGKRRNGVKRGGGRVVHVPLDAADGFGVGDIEEILVLEDALSRLEALNERHARVVELRVFAGMTIEETAAALGVSPDRKSTRLNSSHVKISYAVFCLKK